MTFSFPRNHRLRKRRQYRLVKERGVFMQGKKICVTVMRQDSPVAPLLGISTPKRFGKACKRNRFKRIVREAYRLIYSKIPLGCIVHVSPRAYAAGSSMQQIQEELLELLNL